jgi:hypothetical protein
MNIEIKSFSHFRILISDILRSIYAYSEVLPSNKFSKKKEIIRWPNSKNVCYIHIRNCSEIGMTVVLLQDCKVRVEYTKDSDVSVDKVKEYENIQECFNNRRSIVAYLFQNENE